MPRKSGYKQINLLITADQHALLTEAASLSGVNVSEFVRRVLAANVPGFDNTRIPQPGTYDRSAHKIVEFLDSHSPAEIENWLEGIEG